MHQQNLIPSIATASSAKLIKHASIATRNGVVFQKLYPTAAIYISRITANVCHPQQQVITKAMVNCKEQSLFYG